MGYFTNINLYNFRNFDNYSLQFSKNCNVFFGNNGSGKTNLLEAISLLSKGRGLRQDKVSNMVKKNKKEFFIKSNFINDSIFYDLLSKTNETDTRLTKIFTVNNDKSKEGLDNIYSLMPFLYFLPETERFFISSPSNRRNFIDRFIFTHFNNYNRLINEYNKSILERSKLLTNGKDDINWLDRIENNISKLGIKIYFLRQQQINSLLFNLNIFFKDFNLPYTINYKINDNNFYEGIDEEFLIINLKKNRQIDGIIGGSKIGPHKSDYIFYVNNEFKVSQLSTGQQKTIILLMFLSQCKFLSEFHKKQPILLMDEVCSHLDELNRKILLSLVESIDIQSFMTGTTKDLFSFLSTNTNFCNITH